MSRWCTFDDPDFSEALRPQLTSVAQAAAYELGAQGAELLLKRIADPGDGARKTWCYAPNSGFGNRPSGKHPTLAGAAT